MRFFWISKYHRTETVKAVTRKSECGYLGLIDTAVLIKRRNNEDEDEILLLSDDSSVETSADLVICFLNYCKCAKEAENLEELNSNFYKLCGVWEKIKKINENLQLTAKDLVGMDFGNEEIESINESFSSLATNFSSMADKYKELITKKAGFYRDEIGKTIKEGGFEMISVWTDSFARNSFARKRSLNFIDEPVETVGNINVQTNKAYEALDAFYKLKLKES